MPTTVCSDSNYGVSLFDLQSNVYIYIYTDVHMSLDLETVANLAGKHEVRQNYIRDIKSSTAAAAAAAPTG